MDEDIAIINKETRNEKIKNFFIKNKKKIIISISVIILVIFGFFIYKDFNKKSKIELADRYNIVKMNFITSGNKAMVVNELVNIVHAKDRTYSPLALYFLIDNNIIDDNQKINELFDTVINETSLEKEIKNLLIYKKALFNSDFESENNLITILKPIINSNSIWKSHALYLMAEYFYFKNEKQKSKDFFDQIIALENVNSKIKRDAQKRLNRDFSE